MITRINDPKNIVSCKCSCKSTSRKCNLNKKWNNNKYQCECKKPIKKNHVWKEDCAWNHSACVCGCDKHCKINECLKCCTFIKVLLVIF